MSISKAKLKELAAYRLEKHCEADGLFVVEGAKMAAEAARAGIAVRVLCATAEWLAANDAPQGAEVYEVSQAELERLSLMRSPNQVWLLAARETAVPTASSALTLALDRLQDPGNMGTIMRTADWYGVRRIVCSRDTVSCYNPKVVQASMGAVFRTRVEYTDLPQWLAACGMPVYGATLDGQPLTAVDNGEKVLLIGNESRGVSAEALACVTHRVTIPNIGGTAESLNAAVAAAILTDRLAGAL